MANPDNIFSRIKGGGIRMLSYGSSCGFDCNTCSSDLPELPRKIQTHDHPSYVPNWNTFDPECNPEDQRCTAADEVVTPPATIPNVPVGYVMHRVYIPPYTILKGLGVTHTKPEDPYGLANTTLDGLNYSVIANTVDVTTCPPTVGALVAGAVPTELTNITPALAPETIVAAVSPATAGYNTGANGLMLSYLINAVPTNNSLSAIKASLTLQANSETFNALIR